MDFMKLLRVVVCVTLAFHTLWSANRAFTDNDRNRAERRAGRIIDFHEQQQRAEQLERDIENSNKVRREEKEESASPTQETAKQFYFDKILFSNYKTSADIPNELKSIIKKYTKKYISASDILKIVQETSNYFLSKGYSTTIVGIENMDLKRRILTLKINFGYLNKIYINGKANTLKSKMSIPFSIKGDTILNIRRIDQGLENINRVSYDTKLYIAPSNKLGFSDIFIERKPKPGSISVSIDNSADKDRGMMRANLSTDLNDLLGINDVLTFYGSYRILKDSARNKENLYVGSYSIPFGWFSASYTIQFNDIKSNVEGDFGNYTHTNTTLKQIFSVDSVLYRNSSTKLKLFAKLNVKNVTNKIENQLLSGSSGRYDSLFLGADILKYIQNGYLYADFTYKSGLRKRDKEESNYKIDYNILEFNILLSKFIYHNEDLMVSYKGNAGGSYSKDTLLYADKFYVGDEYTVRGFKESSAAWDLGAYLNNTLFFKFFAFPYVEPFVGVDFGYGRDYELLYDDFLVGIACGLKVSYKHFSADVTFSRDVRKGNGMPAESIPIYARASLSF